MDINKAVATDEEENILYKAVEDFEENGETEIRCPRCGKKLIFQGNSTSYRIGCEDKQCTRLTVRGI